MLTKFANGQWFNLADVRKVVSGTSSDGAQHYVSIGIIPAAFFPTREEADAERDQIAALVNAKHSGTVLDIRRVRNLLREVKQIANAVQAMPSVGVPDEIFTYMQLLATGMLDLFIVIDAMLTDQQIGETNDCRNR